MMEAPVRVGCWAVLAGVVCGVCVQKAGGAIPEKAIIRELPLPEIGLEFYSEGWNLNDLGTVVGNVLIGAEEITGVRPFRWPPGQEPVVLPWLGLGFAGNSEARAINSSNMIVGDAGPGANAVVWTPPGYLGTFVIDPSLPGTDKKTGMVMTGVNDRGEGVGVAYPGNPFRTLSHLVWQYLELPFGGVAAFELAINESSLTVGTVYTEGNPPHGALWQEDGTHQLASEFSTFRAINDLDRIAGTVMLPNMQGLDGPRPAMWTSLSDSPTILGDPDSGTAVSIDNLNRVLIAGGNQPDRIWEAGQTRTLMELLGEQSTWTHLSAYAMNDRGQITGLGMKGDGTTAAFLLTLGLLGDMNGDAKVNAFDVTDFELGLASHVQYFIKHRHLAPDGLGDLNGDRVLTAFDTSGFEMLLASGGASAPEPASLGLLLLSALATLRRRSRLTRRAG